MAVDHHISPRAPRLLVLTGATGVRTGSVVYLSPDQVRRIEKLGERFRVTVGLRGDGLPGRARAGSVPLPPHLAAAWYPAYTSRWVLLNPLFYRSLLRPIRRADVVLAIMPVLEAIPALLLARLLGRRAYLLLVARSAGFRISGGDRSAIRRIQAGALMNLAGVFAHRLFTHGPTLAKEFVPQLRRKVTVTMQTTLRPEDFGPVPSRPPSRLELLTVCRLVGTKRVDVVIRAVERLAARGRPAELSVVGDGPEERRLRALAHRTGLGDRIRFYGPLDPGALRARYRSAFAFVLPSEMEGISLAVIEAMASGTPVLASAAGGMADFLRDGVDALVIAPDPDDVAAMVGRLADDPALYVRLATAGHQRALAIGTDRWVDDLDAALRIDLPGARRR